MKIAIDPQVGEGLGKIALSKWAGEAANSRSGKEGDSKCKKGTPSRRETAWEAKPKSGMQLCPDRLWQHLSIRNTGYFSKSGGGRLASRPKDRCIEHRKQKYP